MKMVCSFVVSPAQAAALTSHTERMPQTRASRCSSQQKSSTSPYNSQLLCRKVEVTKSRIFSQLSVISGSIQPAAHFSPTIVSRKSYLLHFAYTPFCPRNEKMGVPKKWIPVLSFFTVFIIIRVSERICGNFLMALDSKPSPFIAESPPQLDIQPRLQHTDQAPLLPIADTQFQNGTVKPIDEPYTKMIVIPRTKDEDVAWVTENFGSKEYIHSSIYSADDSSANLHPPKNKGHEVMIYLSYIIDNYDNLSDVNIFMHSHRYSWHNDALLDHDAVQMISRLSAERVQREGYMNMRCTNRHLAFGGVGDANPEFLGHWEPGCPSWMHPGTMEEDVNKQEETMLAKCWSELFPLDPIPEVLAQPCCAQFAVSRDRIRSLPLAKYVFYRDWLLRTSLSDYISGRVWEYVWQFVFTGKNVVCPKEHVCYCDGFGVCFGGEEEYVAYYKKNDERVRLEEELKKWREDSDRMQQLRGEERSDEAWEIEEPEVGRDLELEGRIKGLQAWCDRMRQLAKENGDVAMNRAVEAGRAWQDGDGF